MQVSKFPDWCQKIPQITTITTLVVKWWWWHHHHHHNTTTITLYHHQSGDGSKITVIWGIFWHQPGYFDTCTAGGAGDKYEVCIMVEWDLGRRLKAFLAAVRLLPFLPAILYYTFFQLSVIVSFQLSDDGTYCLPACQPVSPFYSFIRSSRLHFSVFLQFVNFLKLYWDWLNISKTKTLKQQNFKIHTFLRNFFLLQILVLGKLISTCFRVINSPALRNWRLIFCKNIYLLPVYQVSGGSQA